MEFNSQVCTTIEQSKRLLDLGLSGDTADMLWMPQLSVRPVVGNPNEVCNIIVKDNAIPAWSLNRLIEIYSKGTGNYSFFFPDAYESIIQDIDHAVFNGYLDLNYLMEEE